MPPEARMTAQVFLLVFASALMSVIASLTMRYVLPLVGGLHVGSDGVLGLVLRLARQWTFVLGLVATALAALIWLRVLSVAEVSTCYPILVGLTFVMVSVGAVLLLRESISFLKIVGIAVILAGIVLVAKA